jgi:hypothetical protein
MKVGKKLVERGDIIMENFSLVAQIVFVLPDVCTRPVSIGN